MPDNNMEENISHFILIAPTKKNLPPKIAFQILGTQKLHLGNQVPGSRKFSCPGEHMGTGVIVIPFTNLNSLNERNPYSCTSLS